MAIHWRNVSTLLSRSKSFLCIQNKKVWFYIQDSHFGLPLCDDLEPGGGEACSGDKSSSFQANFSGEQRENAWKTSNLLPPGRLPCKAEEACLRTFMPESIRHFISDVESIAKNTLDSLQGRLINTFQEMKTYTFNVALLSILGKEEIIYREDLKRCYYILVKGYNSMSVNLPGTLFHNPMKARTELSKILGKILCIRRQSKEIHKDLLGSLMADGDEGLTDEQIADNVIGVIFAARDTTASVLTWILKYLAENPSVLEAVTAEQEAIMRNKEENGEEDVLKVVYGGPTEWNSVWALCSSPKWFAHKTLSQGCTQEVIIITLK